MPPEARDKALLFDMLRSARDAVSFLGEVSFDDFKQNAILVAAIERKV
jgi:uncharacterized protein with HEPN domain